MSPSSLRTTDKPTYNKLTPKADGSFYLIPAQQHTMTINDSSVKKKVLMDQAPPAPFNNMYLNVGKERNAITGERVAVEIYHQAPKGKVKESERCETDDKSTHQMPVASGNNDAGPPREQRDLDFCEENEKPIKAGADQTTKTSLG